MILSDIWWQTLLGGIAVYLFCNINFAVIISKCLKKQDIRQCGSGNPGTTNMLRSFGFRYGVLTFFCDALKGALPVLIGIFASPALGATPVQTRFIGYFFAMCAILGHIFPVFLGFKGGKGFASTIGAFLVLDPLWTAIFLVVGFVIFLLCDYMSIFAMLFITSILVRGILLFTVFDGAIMSSGSAWMFIITVAVDWLLVVVAHRGNVKRLFTGTENKSGLRNKLKKKKQDEDK